MGAHCGHKPSRCKPTTQPEHRHCGETSPAVSTERHNAKDALRILQICARETTASINDANQLCCIPTVSTRGRPNVFTEASIVANMVTESRSPMNYTSHRLLR